jgi:hypothetical protein
LWLVLVGNSCEGSVSTQISSPATEKPMSSNTSTTQTIIEYKKYQIEPDDVRFTLGTMKFPRFSIEYPQSFGLIDINYDEAPHFNSEYSEVDFTFPIYSVPKPGISVIVQKPGFRKTANASEEMKRWLTLAQSKTNSIKTESMVVNGISTQYIQFTFRVEDDKNYQPYDVSYRIYTFDYDGLIWTIKMDWYFDKNEPPEADLYFKHALETFRFLE